MSSKEYALKIVLNIGDEDGPYYYYEISPLYKLPLYEISNDLIATSLDNDDNLKHWNLVEENPTNIHKILDKYNITKIIEVHDWYDFFDSDALKNYQKKLVELKNKKLKSYENSVIIFTIFFYNESPRKYVLPTNDRNKKIISMIENKSCCTKKSVGQINNILSKISKYRVYASFQKLFDTYKVSDFIILARDYIEY